MILSLLISTISGVLIFWLVKPAASTHPQIDSLPTVALQPTSENTRKHASDYRHNQEDLVFLHYDMMQNSVKSMVNTLK